MYGTDKTVYWKHKESRQVGVLVALAFIEDVPRIYITSTDAGLREAIVIWWWSGLSSYRPRA
jgi:hypothetical protein